MEKWPLSKESARKHYEKLMMYHQDNRELAQKIIDFQYGLDHYILKEITGFNEPYDQYGWLLKNQIKIDSHKKIGFIPETLVTSIKNLRSWRHEGTHGDAESIDNNTYIYLFQTMAKTISFFSDTLIPEDINNILNNETDSKQRKNKFMNKDCYEFINKEIFSKIEPNTSLYETLLIFLKELGIKHNTDISVYPLNIRTELKHMEQDILSIIREILESFKIKEKKSLAKFVIDDFKTAFKDIKREGIIGSVPSQFRPAPCLKNLKYLEICYENEYINIDEIKLKFKEKYDKMIKWQNLLDKVLKYNRLIDMYNDRHKS